MYMLRNIWFFKKCDLVTHLVSNLLSYLLTDKEIHRGAPLLKTRDVDPRIYLTHKKGYLDITRVCVAPF